MQQRYVLTVVRIGIYILGISVIFSSVFFNKGDTLHMQCTTSLQDAKIWRIDGNEVSSKIIWQKREVDVVDELDMLNIYVGLMASDLHAIVWQNVPLGCKSRLVALDRQTGNETWEIASEELDFFRGVYSIDNGYVVTTDDAVIKYNESGWEVWQNTTLPYKSIRMVYQQQDKL